MSGEAGAGFCRGREDGGTKKRDMLKWMKYQIPAINVICALLLLIVALPLLMLARFNYPMADDWSHGETTYRVVKDGGNLLEVLGEAVRVAARNHTQWEGRYANAFLAALQPGIWGEQYYSVTTWLMLGGLVFSESMLARTLLCRKKGENRWLWLPVIFPLLVLQILYTPYPDECYFWYTGAVNYTFVCALSLVLLSFFIRLARGPRSKAGRIFMTAASCILAVLVGGDNFATSLSCLLILVLASALFFLFDRGAFRRTWIITVVTGIGFWISVSAPGNQVRLDGNFDGETFGAAEAVALSLWRSFTNIFSWTNGKVVLVMLLILPFLWKAVRRLDCGFPLPGLFTAVSFGIYASQATATCYVDGTMGGGRMGDVLFFTYYLWLALNAGYWIGWLQRKDFGGTGSLMGRFRRLMQHFRGLCGKYLLLYVAVVGGLLLGCIYFQDMKDTTFYKGYRMLRQGWAQQYGEEWEARLEVLKDESILEVEFAPLTVYPEMLTYADIQPEDDHWINSGCARYYGKTYVHLIH